MMDSVPLVAPTGQVARHVIGTEAFQETDIVSVATAVTRGAFQVQDVRDIPEVVAEAFRLARAGRPGPVLIDVPKDIQEGSFPSSGRPSRRQDLGRSTEAGASGVTGLNDLSRPNSRKDPRNLSSDVRTEAAPLSPEVIDGLDRAAALLNQSDRPVVMVGRGVVLAGVSRMVRVLAERADLPVVTTLLGLDAFATDHRLALGMPGMHGTERANRGIQGADLVLGLGLRFDDRVIGKPDTFAPNAQVVHFDIDEAAVGRTIEPDLAVVGDLATTLPEFVRRTTGKEHREWWRDLRRWSRGAEPTTHEGRIAEPYANASFPIGPLSARQAIRSVARRIGDTNAIVVTDVGQHPMWLAQELPSVDPRSHLTSGGGWAPWVMPSRRPSERQAVPPRERPAVDLSGWSSGMEDSR